MLLLPAFFAFTGMRTEIGLVSGVDEWLICGLIILVATAGKFGGTLAAARFTGLPWRQAAALGILMNTRGLMELDRAEHRPGSWRDLSDAVRDDGADGARDHDCNDARPRVARTWKSMRQLMVVGALVAAAAADVALGLEQVRPSFLHRATTGELRVLTFNIGDDLIFPDPGGRIDPNGLDGPSRFLRMARALQPDVLCLQEATVGSERAVETMNEVLPPGIGSTWYAHHAVDDVIVSRFPLSALAGGIVEQGEKQRGHAMALVDLPDASYDRDLYVVCVHNQSGSGALNVALRQRQSDAIAKWIRDAKSRAEAWHFDRVRRSSFSVT